MGTVGSERVRSPGSRVPSDATAMLRRPDVRAATGTRCETMMCSVCGKSALASIPRTVG